MALKLSVVRAEPLPSVVEAIEALLERAKAGEVRGFAYVFATPDGIVMHQTVPGEADLARLHFAASHLQDQIKAISREEV